MLIAVSCLSPVSTHTRMPAARRVLMALGTPCCSRSSIPVDPSSVSPAARWDGYGWPINAFQNGISNTNVSPAARWVWLADKRLSNVISNTSVSPAAHVHACDGYGWPINDYSKYSYIITPEFDG
jgi:hypothetical protein